VTELFLVFIAACLADNLVLDYLLGVGPVFAVSRKIETALGLSIAMILILPVTTLCSYALDIFVLVPLELGYVQLFTFAITTTALTLLIDKILQQFRPALHEKVTVFVPLLLVNTSLVGVALLYVRQETGLLASVLFGMGSATGFGIVVIVFSALRERIIVADVPEAFKGAPILLITLGILSMAFMGFSGII